MSLSTILQRLALGAGIAACSSPLESEQFNGDAGMAKNGPALPANQLGEEEEEDCYTNGCPRTNCTLYDNYAGDELDACKWKVRAGSPYLRDGYLRLAQSAIESVIENAGETSEDTGSPCSKLVTELVIRQAGTGYAELHFKLDDKIAVYAHPLGDVNKRWLSIACLANGESSPLTLLEMGKWNTLRVEVDVDVGQKAGQTGLARLYRNGELIGSVSCPQSVQARRVDLQAFGELAMEIDYVMQWCGE